MGRATVGASGFGSPVPFPFASVLMTGKDVGHVEFHGSRLAAEVLDGVALPFFFTQVVQPGVEWGLDGRFESKP